MKFDTILQMVVEKMAVRLEKNIRFLSQSIYHILDKLQMHVKYTHTHIHTHTHTQTIKTFKENTLRQKTSSQDKIQYHQRKDCQI